MELGKLLQHKCKHTCRMPMWGFPGVYQCDDCDEYIREDGSITRISDEVLKVP